MSRNKSVLDIGISCNRMKVGVNSSQIFLNKNFISSFIKSIEEKHSKKLKTIVSSLYPIDFAQLLSKIGPNLRQEFFLITDSIPDSDVLLELDINICTEIVNFFTPERFARHLFELEVDEIVDIVCKLSADLQKSILVCLPDSLSSNVKLGLKSKPYTARRLMCHNWIYVPADWSVDQVLKYCEQKKEDLPDEFYEIFVVSSDNKLVGFVPVHKLISLNKQDLMSDCMSKDIIYVPEDMGQEEIAELFQRYNLRTVPVINKDQSPLGVILIDDILDVVKEEAEEDILALGGIQDEEDVSDKILKVSQSRLIWLVTNLFTAIISASVINVFIESIQKKVTLAVLLPIVASMGGNAGTQAMTVTVRRIAKQEIENNQIFSLILKELMVGFINGLILSFIASSIVFLWFGEIFTASVVALAMMVNVSVSTCIGLIVPLTMDNIFKVDPAIASPVFVTMISDILGALLVLGMSTIILSLY